MADEKSASTAAKSARASSAKNPPKNSTKAAPGDENSTASDTGTVQGSSAGSTSTRTDTTALAQHDSSQGTPAGDNANPGAQGTDSGATHGTSASNADDEAQPSSSSNNSSTGEAVKEAVTGRPELGSGQRLAGGTEHDYPAQNSPRLSDPDGGSGEEPVEQFGAVGTLSPTRLDERNRVGQVDDDVKDAQFPTPRFNQGPPSVVVQTQVPAHYAAMYTQIDEDLFEVVYREGATTPSAKLVAPAGAFVRTDYLAEQMAHAVKDIAKAKAAQGMNPGDDDKAEHRREVAQQ